MKIGNELISKMANRPAKHTRIGVHLCFLGVPSYPNVKYTARAFIYFRADILRHKKKKRIKRVFNTCV